MNGNLKKIIFTLIVVIIVIGLVALYSASYQNIRVPRKIFYGQLVMAILGIGAIWALSYFDYRKFYDMAYILYAVNIIFLIGIFIFGRYALGAKRWIEFFGVNFQPSELMKLSVILVLARYFTDQKPTISFYRQSLKGGFWADLLIPLFLVVFPMLLIFKQPDLGTALLLLGIFVVILYASGISYKYFLGLLVFCAMAVPLLWSVMKPYQKDRLLVFLNPNIDPLGAGYTIIQSKIAVGSGQIFGKGWLAGTQNQLNFLPERHTDFIFSVIGEEWGLIGSFFLLSCFFALIMLGLNVVEQTKEKFGYLAALGIITIFALQVIINIGMVLGLCPIVGLTLPLVSYGKSSFLVFVLMLGFLLNLSRRRTIF
ncbi:MAG: rod shape-determining protein RodA [Candidatus Aceula meridiana]|nr:rod shape-determining protein RodA [Candidatus Aceula meridiana]